ncbi:uncharacterized protein LOC131627225 [Vicia villosa]|uniref:uncharacterized protein LOC131627225 n=1 Tax=Vicia villosa TaxID=3911 RepID=UPI00273B7410|nr:uncharacterized protein LOC131627225 [Vicia villosa]
MGKLISKFQSEFIEGRQLFDGVLVLNEVLDFAKRSKKCLVLTVDFEKAYDCVSWGFLRYVLKRIGFGARWLSWMEGTVFSSSISILVNGSPTREFEASRGLRQGDPLSPFLFLFVAEGVAGMMRNAVAEGSFKGFQLSSDLSFEMLQFADDTVLICDGSKENLWDFLWGRSEGHRKVCWVSWEKICRPRKKGWLGVKNIEIFNLALMSKWGWRFLSDREVVWYKFLEFRYGVGMEALCGVIPDRDLLKSSLWWRDVRNVCGFEVNDIPWFSNCISRRLGDGEGTRFWEHAWLGPTPFKVLFPHLFSLCSMPNFSSPSSSSSCVANMGGWVDNVWKWDLGFSEDVLEGGVACDRSNLLNLLEGVAPNPGVKDKWIWWRHGEGFSVKNCFRRIYSLRSLDVVLNDGCKLELKRLWEARVPSKFQVFGWRLLFNSLPTRRALCIRGMERIVSDILCPLCGLEEEPEGHLFLVCAHTRNVWKEVFNWLGSDLEVDVGAMDDTLENEMGFGVVDYICEKLRGVVKPLFFAFLWLLVCWCIWLERNKVVFKECCWNPTEILIVIKNLGWDWLSILAKGRGNSTKEVWLCNPCAYVGV